jgi:DNA (cytosine-5)-methyltransferase 1
VLKREGYHVTHKVVESDQLGYATQRPRVYIVATTQRGFSWSKALKKRRRKLRAKDILLPPGHPLITSARTSQGNWFSTRDRSGTGNTLRTLWERESWTPLFIDPDDAIPTIAKNYYKPAPTGPFVVHPTKPDTYRLLTVEEIRRAHEVPEGYLLPGAVGTQAESLGQGVIVPLVQSIVEALPGGAPSRTIDVPYQRVSNPAPVVPMYYGTGPLYSTLPWGWLA